MATNWYLEFNRCVGSQVGRGSYKGPPADFPLLGCNTRLRKLALTSSTINLYHSPILSWDLPNLGFLKLDGLHAVNAGSSGGSQVQINCATSSKLTSLQCLKRLNLDWKDSTPPPGFCFGPQSLTGLTTLAASCGVMTLDLAALQLRDLCLDYFTPSSITHGFPTTLRLLELRLGTLWGNQGTIQVSLPCVLTKCHSAVLRVCKESSYVIHTRQLFTHHEFQYQQQTSRA